MWWTVLWLAGAVTIMWWVAGPTVKVVPLPWKETEMAGHLAKHHRIVAPDRVPFETLCRWHAEAHVFTECGHVHEPGDWSPRPDTD